MTLLSHEEYQRILDTRITEPRALQRALSGRPRRSVGGADGRLLLLAADHTARGMLFAGGEAMAFADRRGLLDRLLRGLSDSRVDGVLASADILEELALLGALDAKLAIGTMNRGGIIGAQWELDDRQTAYDAQHVASSGLDGGKCLLRIEETDPGVARTIERVAAITTQLADLELMAMIEPLPYVIKGGRATLDPSEERLIQAVSIASGLGSSSAYTWLKIPATANPARVAAATTCPILLLGGDPGANWDQVFRQWEAALVVPNIRGLIPGRALLYPESLDVEDAIGRAASLVHGTTS